MTLALIALSFLVFVVAGYFLYGSRIARLFHIDGQTQTPAHTKQDGNEYIPTHPFYLFCQHFSAIAASGPIAGPIIACQKWGWLPCMLWISIGVVFIGSVHDFSMLTASVRHQGCSIAEITKKHVGNRAGTMLLFFIWVALVYIIVAFTQVTAATFVSRSEELQSVAIHFNPGGAVAAAAIFYLALCLLLGVINRLINPPLWLTTVIFIPAMFAVIWLGTHFSTLFVFEQKAFEVGILVYCAIASLIPIWLLLQPRGYLGGFVLLFVLAIGIIGIFSGQYEVLQPVYIENTNPTSSFTSLFPFLFVTIACGACSGFHGLVCGGTTSKQIANEKHLQPIGYGAMLAEGMVALIAMSTIMIFSSEQVQGLKPGTIYGKGIGEFLTLIIGQEHRIFATTFGAMAFSTFVFDTLDVATRIGRYLIQELLGWTKPATKYVALFITLAPPLFIISIAKSDSWISFWTLFGSANQLLAGLSLLSITLWLARSKKPFLVTLLPMAFVLCITLWSLSLTAYESFGASAFSVIGFMNGLVASLLIVVALYILSQAALRR
jgi:carbon starvation protein